MRRNYLITYDIADDRRRTRIFHTLEDNGDHTQFSVFLCQLSTEELAALRGQLQQMVHQNEDQLLIVDLGKSTHDVALEIEAIGRVYRPSTRTMIV